MAFSDKVLCNLSLDIVYFIILNILSKMQDNSNNKVFSIIFKYLNGMELFNASQVCRSWSKFAKTENEYRGLACFTVQTEYSEFFQKYCTITKEIIQFLPTVPCFYMFFVAGNTSSLDHFNKVSECACKYLPPYCYLILWHSNNPLNEKIALTGWSFPVSPNIQFKTYTFVKQYIKNCIYCPELNYVFEPNLQPNFQDFFIKSNHTRCMIFLCQKEYINEGRDLLESLNNKFQKNTIFVWGGITNLMLICNSVNYTVKCKAYGCFLFTLINSTNMRINILNWNSRSPKIAIKYKLAKLKLFMKLERYSICLMFCSGVRRKESYHEDRVLFKKFFPKVPLVQVTGDSSFGGIGIQNALRILSEDHQKRSIIPDDTTNVILLTYE